MSVMKWIVRILLVFLLYVIAGALLPFAFPKKVSEDYSSKVDPSAFTGREPVWIGRRSWRPIRKPWMFGYR